VGRVNRLIAVVSELGIGGGHWRLLSLAQRPGGIAMLQMVGVDGTGVLRLLVFNILEHMLSEIFEDGFIWLVEKHLSCNIGVLNIVLRVELHHPVR